MNPRTFMYMMVAAAGQTVTTAISTSTGGTVPNTSNGTKPRFVRFASTGTCYVRLGIGGQTALITDVMVAPGAPVILALQGSTHWAAIDDGVSVKVNVVPLEDS